MKLYVEGGGDAAALKAMCREGFSTFLAKAGVSRRPRIVACGSRRDAYDSFCTAVRQGEDALLLVDSEAPVVIQQQQGSASTWRPWRHLKARQGDGWDMPAESTESDCHLMVQIMESWFLADRGTLGTFFGQGFHEKSLPAVGCSIEDLDKEAIYAALSKATRNCKTKGAYGKGQHSFKLLGQIDPTKITDSSPWARRFVDEVKKRMESA